MTPSSPRPLAVGIKSVDLPLILSHPLLHNQAIAPSLTSTKKALCHGRRNANGRRAVAPAVHESPHQRDEEDRPNGRKEPPADRRWQPRGFAAWRVPDGLEPRQKGGRDIDDLLPSERVIDQPGEGNAVADELEERDGRVPDDDRNDDEEDVLEDAREGHDEARSLANLCRC